MSSRPTRWSPTPEQLMILEEMYQKGLRSPNTTQIQMITAHLSMYGKIEGKNVFYWFQNHKARDRQKLRKRLSKQMHHHLHHHHLPFSGPTTTDELPPPLHLHCLSSSQPRLRIPNINDHLCCIDLSRSSPQPQPPLSSSAGYLLQATVEDDASQLPTMTVNFHQRKTDQTTVERPCMMRTTTYGRDCILMMGTGPTLPCCTTNTTPLKTLQLFPTSSSTNVKEDQPLNLH